MAVKITAIPWGCSIFGEAVTLRRVESDALSFEILDYGATLRSLCVKDAHGAWVDVVLGYDSLAEYEQNDGYLGAVVGRVCNRIAGAEFELEGKRYPLYQNDGVNHLHGGKRGFDKYVWAVEELPDGLRLTRTSPDGEEGYPGTLRVMVTYTFTDDNELLIHYEAVSDRDTLCNLTNHSYFNLEGEGAGPVTDHVFEFNCDTFTVVDEKCIPTGEQRDVTGTPFDLRQPTRLADGLAQEETDEQLRFGKGFDHNFNINDPEAGLRFAVHVEAPVSGRTMDVFTDMPAVQFYCGNMLEGVNPGACGRLYHKREGFCLETQYAPDSIHHPEFPDSVLRAGEKYDYLTIFSFDVAE